MKLYVKSNNVEAFDNTFKKMKDAKKSMKDLAKSTEDDVANTKDQIEKFKTLNNTNSATGSESVGMLDAIIDCYNTGFSTLTKPIYKALHLEFDAPEYDVEESLELADDNTISELYYTLRQIAIDNAYYEVLDDFDVDVLESTDITASTVTDILDEYLPDETYAKLTNVEKKIIAKASNQKHQLAFISGALETLDLLDVGMSDAMRDAWEIISMNANKNKNRFE